MKRVQNVRLAAATAQQREHEAMSRCVVASALSAYRGVAPRDPCAAAPLAVFLAAELYHGSRGETEAARLQQAADQVDFAMESLRHVRDRLRELAVASTSLPLPLGPGAPCGAGR
ncbi:hypothetical protein [Longimicrobium sp.]|uniref:hypothetical protein n=1 Tax=Longimicrobium sp. TaxID=2029185 RepID=UPI002E35703E|nr:hypothetical protein [Longimicrobium sp.]HEX6039668.1 hypothetical protein [Longimicrobium sp.]